MLSREDVLRELPLIVAGNEDQKGACFYGYPVESDGERTVEPLCIIGHLLHRLEPEVFARLTEGVLREDGPEAAPLEVGLNGLPLDMASVTHVEELHLEFEDGALRAGLEKMQQRQDARETWGSIMEELPEGVA